MQSGTETNTRYIEETMSGKRCLASLHVALPQLGSCDLIRRECGTRVGDVDSSGSVGMERDHMHVMLF